MLVFWVRYSTPNYGETNELGTKRDVWNLSGEMCTITELWAIREGGG